MWHPSWRPQRGRETTDKRTNEQKTDECHHRVKPPLCGVGLKFLKSGWVGILSEYTEFRYASAACVVLRYPSVPHVRGFWSKRINISWKFFNHQLATSFWFFRTERHGNIPTGTPLTGAWNAGVVGKNRDLGHYLTSSRVVNAATARCYQRGAAGPWMWWRCW